MKFQAGLGLFLISLTLFISSSSSKEFGKEARSLAVIMDDPKVSIGPKLEELNKLYANWPQVEKIYDFDRLFLPVQPEERTLGGTLELSAFLKRLADSRTSDHPLRNQAGDFSPEIILDFPTLYWIQEIEGFLERILNSALESPVNP